MSYSSAARSTSNPYVLPTTSNCCGNDSNVELSATGCCEECHCGMQSYEHLPRQRLQHPPQVTAAMRQHRQQLQQQHPQHQQLSCITTMQQTTTTQQLQALPCHVAAATPAPNSCQRYALPVTTTSATYASNAQPAATQHCHSACNNHNNHSNFKSSNNATPMFFVPFSMPLPHQQHHFAQQQQQSPLPPASAKFKSSFCQTPAPPPPQPPPLPPPPLLLPFTLHYQQLPAIATAATAAAPSLTEQLVSGALPACAPPIPPTRNVLPLKAVAAAAIKAHQQNGRLPRNLPALRAMEMALRTNSFASCSPTEEEGGGQQDMDETDDSDSEMEYMIPLHSE
ncbi:mediator of RNA polymerase II transcription subunit 15-like [Drosophila innubila]|uniref:mediator of RNA polymerase II transcription subunit 15-like n=1 Tax=Drosophila innubila TaxID=198719 RepID=UPI00148CE689|nr:mediator of RNA polymerase II transcription subunit 15-like [Drosophila innubila]